VRRHPAAATLARPGFPGLEPARRIGAGPPVLKPFKGGDDAVAQLTEPDRSLLSLILHFHGRASAFVNCPAPAAGLCFRCKQLERTAMTRNILLALMPVLMVAACGTPQEQCISRNTREYRTVSNLLTEVEGNLARGYAWQERTVTRSEWDECRHVWIDKEGNRRLGYRPCLRDV